MDEILNGLPAPMKNRVGGARDINGIAENLDRFNRNVAHRILRFASFRLARAVAYLWLRERQLMQLQGIVKGRQLRLSPEVIRRAVAASSRVDDGE